MFHQDLLTGGGEPARRAGRYLRQRSTDCGCELVHMPIGPASRCCHGSVTLTCYPSASTSSRKEQNRDTAAPEAPTVYRSKSRSGGYLHHRRNHSFRKRPGTLGRGGPTRSPNFAP